MDLPSGPRLTHRHMQRKGGRGSSTVCPATGPTVGTGSLAPDMSVNPPLLQSVPHLSTESWTLMASALPQPRWSWGGEPGPWAGVHTGVRLVSQSEAAGQRRGAMGCSAGVLGCPKLKAVPLEGQNPRAGLAVGAVGPRSRTAPGQGTGSPRAP